MSKIVRWSTVEGSVQNAFTSMKYGTKFDLTEAYLNKWYVGMWYEIEEAFKRDDILSAEDKNIAIYELDELIDAQHALYGHTKPNKLYLSIKQSYDKLRYVIYKETNIFTSQDKLVFEDRFHFNPHWDRWFNSPDSCPTVDSYNNLEANIVNELKTRSLDHLIPIINSIILEITDVIKNHLTSINLFSDQPDSMKKDLLEMIINCPYTNVLKMFPRVRMSDLSFIIFNHPIQKNYFNSYFSSFGIKSPTFNALRHRISTLTIEDFRRVGLGDEIDDYTLRKLKQHAENAISDWINKYKKISFEGVGTTYRTEELRKLQFDVFNALWKAVAYHEEDFFISYTKVFHTLGYSKETAGSFYTQFITNSLMMGNRIIRGLMNKLDQFILEESYITPLGYSGIVNMEPSQQVSQQVYSEAKELLILYQKSLEEAQNTWLGTEHGARSWFDGFFEIFSNDPRYTKGFKNPTPLKEIWRDLNKVVPISTIQNIAKRIFGEDLYKKKWTSNTDLISEVLKSKIKDTLLHEFEKEKPRSLRSIADDFPNVSKNIPTNIAKEIFTDEEFDAKWGQIIPVEVKQEIIDLLKKEYKKEYPITISIMSDLFPVSNSTILRFGRKLFGEDKFTNKWHNDDVIRSGYLGHQCINNTLTKFFQDKNIKYYCELKIFHDFRRVDGLLINIEYLYKRLFNLHSAYYLNIDRNIYSKIKAIIFEFTSDITFANMIKKISKYQHPQIMLFIINIGKYWKDPTSIIINDIDVIYPDNFRIINYDLFLKLIGLDEEYKKRFLEIIECISKRDIENLKKCSSSDLTLNLERN